MREGVLFSFLFYKTKNSKYSTNDRRNSLSLSTVQSFLLTISFANLEESFFTSKLISGSPFLYRWFKQLLLFSC